MLQNKKLCDSSQEKSLNYSTSLEYLKVSLKIGERGMFVSYKEIILQ